MLSTPWSTSFGLRVPIVNAPMGGVAGGRLAAAVTAAGGLGMVGMGSVATRELLQTQLQHVHGMFGIGLVDWVMRNETGLLEDALAARPVLLSVSFGTDWSWVDKAHDAGIGTVTQVYDSLGARQAVDAGIDILVARGSEGGGHGEVSSGRCRCSTPSWMPWTAPGCRCSRAAASRRRVAWPPCWPPVRAGRGWAPAWRHVR